MPMGDLTAAGDGCDVAAGATEVIIVRHGETFWNVDHRLQGQLESDLNEVGRLQAKAVAARLATGEIPFTAVYSSDLRRAADTAQAIADFSGHKEVAKVAELRERHVGWLQGLTLDEAKVKQPEAYHAFRSHDPEQTVPGGGESLNGLRKRVSKALEDVASKHRGQRIVVVCHGGVIVSLYRHATGRNPPGHVLNTSIGIIRISEDREWEVLRWGDVKHLHQRTHHHNRRHAHNNHHNSNKKDVEEDEKEEDEEEGDILGKLSGSACAFGGSADSA